MKNFWTAILITICLGLFIDVVYLHREVAKQELINQALYQYQRQTWELLQYTMRDVDAIGSQVAVWQEMEQYPPGWGVEKGVR